MQESDVFCVCICSVGQRRRRRRKSLACSLGSWFPCHAMPCHAILRDRFLRVASQQFQRFRGFITYLYLVLCVIRRFIFDRSGEKEISTLGFYTRQHSTADSDLLSQYNYNIPTTAADGPIFIFFAGTILSLRNPRFLRVFTLKSRPYLTYNGDYAHSSE